MQCFQLLSNVSLSAYPTCYDSLTTANCYFFCFLLRVRELVFRRGLFELRHIIKLLDLAIYTIYYSCFPSAKPLMVSKQASSVSIAPDVPMWELHVYESAACLGLNLPHQAPLHGGGGPTLKTHAHLHTCTHNKVLSMMLAHSSHIDGYFRPERGWEKESHPQTHMHTQTRCCPLPTPYTLMVIADRREWEKSLTIKHARTRTRTHAHTNRLPSLGREGAHTNTCTLTPYTLMGGRELTVLSIAHTIHAHALPSNTRAHANTCTD